MILGILLGLDQISETDLVDAGLEDVKPGEEVVGVLSLELRRLYTAYRRQAELVLAKTKKRTTTRMTLDELIARVRRLEFDTEGVTLLQTIFWREFQEEFGANGKNITIRKGGKVVVTTQPKADPVVEVMDAIIKTIATTGCGNPNCENCKRLRPSPFVFFIRQRPGRN